MSRQNNRKQKKKNNNARAPNSNVLNDQNVRFENIKHSNKNNTTLCEVFTAITAIFEVNVGT